MCSTSFYPLQKKGAERTETGLDISLRCEASSETDTSKVSAGVGVVAALCFFFTNSQLKLFSYLCQEKVDSIRVEVLCMETVALLFATHVGMYTSHRSL